MSKARSAVAMLSLSRWLAGYWMRRRRLTQTADDQEAEGEGEGKAEAEAHPGDRRRLTCDGEPAQANESVEAQMPGVVGQALLVDFGHHRTE
jgi:hypothetical protein